MIYEIWLSLVLRAGNARVADIVKKYGSAESIYNTRCSELKCGGLFTEAELSRMKTVGLDTARKIDETCRSNGIDIIHYSDRRYPEQLRCIADPPLLLYVKGVMPDLDSLPSICIVGPRAASEFGKKAAFSLALRLSKAGMIIVSGGAEGCDTCAHRGALSAGGITVLVAGGGILNSYPVSNTSLRNEILKNGCIISEYPPDAPAAGYNFPVRNRIMSGLCSGTAVIEAGIKSGALITATHANEQGRDVFVVPGRPSDKQYEGSNALLRDGAKPLLDASDIFNEYLPRFPDKINVEKAFEKSSDTETEKINKKISVSGLSKTAQIVYNQLNTPKFFPDELDSSELSGADIISALTELEVEGLIKSLAGGCYAVL